jgi:ABC-2 type transport system ATP-binding protein
MSLNTTTGALVSGAPQSASADTAITTSGLSRTFGSVRAVDDLTIAVPSGKIFGFLGTNGAGKTTTIYLLLGLLDPTSGEASVLGHNIRTAGALIREQSGSLLEYNGLYEQLSAYDNLDFYGRIWGMPRAERAQRIDELLEMFDLRGRAQDRAGTWSRGMKQKLAVARAIFHHPRLVFLDEPTDGLDPAAAAALRQDLLTLVEREGMTIFLTTHNLAEAEQLCANVAILRSGVLLAQGSPQELRERTSKPQVEVRGRGFSAAILAGLRADQEITLLAESPTRIVFAPGAGVETSQIVDRLVSSGVQVSEVHQMMPTFEETFLHIVGR